MYIVLALIAAAVLGIALHFSLPHRADRGVILTPGISVAAAAAVYALLTWLQWGEANLWLWVVTLIAAGAVSAVATIVIGSRRTSRDAAERKRLGIA